MKKTFCYLFIFYFVSGCALGIQSLTPHPFTDSTDTEELLLENVEISDRKILALMTYVEMSYEWRKRAITTYQRIDGYRKSHHGKISSKDLLDMHDLAIVYALRIRRPLMEILRSGNFFMDFKNDIKFQTDKHSYVKHNVVRYENNLGVIIENEEDLKEDESTQQFMVDVYYINPHDLQGHIFLRDFKISFASSLVLLDNYALALEPYFRNKILRRSLFYDIPDSHRNARKIIKKIWLSHDRKDSFSINLIRAFGLYQESQLITEGSAAKPPSPYLEELDKLIQNSFAFEELIKSPDGKDLMKYLMSRVKLFLRKRRDDLFLIRKSTTHILSKIFGHGVGVFHSREGKLKNMPEDEYHRLVSKMRPLDILLEKTPFRLTDKFIPGHYGHVAIWVGTENELKELDVWELLPHYYKTAKESYSYEGPPFQDAIRSGKHIIEALRPGVEINSMNSFLNIDDLAVIRLNDCPKEVTFSKSCLTLKDKRRYLLEAFKQIGKDYDFNFDVNTENKIVCSEIAYRTFLNIDFEITKALGKYSIHPDQVMLKADDMNDPFYPVILYYKGKRVSGEMEFLRDVLKALLKRDYETVENIIAGNEANLEPQP